MVSMDERYFNDILNDGAHAFFEKAGWSQDVSYKLLPEISGGRYQAVRFPHCRIALLEAEGGVLHALQSAKNTLSIVAVLQCDTAACLGRTKLKTGDLTVLDDKSIQLFFTAASYRLLVLNFDRRTFRSLSKLVSQYAGTVIDDGAKNIASFALPILDTPPRPQQDPKDKSHTEHLHNSCQTMLHELYSRALPYRPKLTKGETYALEICDRVYNHTEPTISIKAFAKAYKVTEQTLQNAFKSLFGITPYKFVRNLKLNQVRQELLQANPVQVTVIAIANKWGFVHMGHFSSYYTQLFGENPSVTLRRTVDASEN